MEKPGHNKEKFTQKQNQNRTGNTANPELHVWHLELVIKSAGLQKTRIVLPFGSTAPGTHRLSPGLAPVHVHSSLCVSHGPDTSNILWSPFHLCIVASHGLLAGTLTLYTGPGLSNSLRTWSKTPWPLQSCIFHTCKASKHYMDDTA